MRRLCALAIVLLVLTSCGDTQRPEGIVERWLQSLDQGAAGAPETFAPDAISEQILPGFRNLDPGQFDVIEVGHGTVPVMDPAFAGRRDLAIPFRVVDTDGGKIRGAAWVTADASHIALVRIGDPEGPLPSEGGPPIVATSVSLWLAGVLAAVTLIGVALLMMWLVRRSVRTTSR